MSRHRSHAISWWLAMAKSVTESTFDNHPSRTMTGETQIHTPSWHLLKLIDSQGVPCLTNEPHGQCFQLDLREDLFVPTLA